MTLFQLTAAIVTLTALGSYLNHRYLRLPPTIGLMAFSLTLSLLTLLLGQLGLADLRAAGDFVSRVDFSEVLLHGMLSFLLFAGAMHINLESLRNVKWAVCILATVGVVIATFVTGALVWFSARQLGLGLAFAEALLFGALISPTDPIAVLSILKEAGLPKNLYTRIGGESLFNDGVGVVVFLTILGIVTGDTKPTFSSVAALLGLEAIGGAVAGVLGGWIVYRLLRSIDDPKTEIMLTLALVTGGYSLAEALHLSAPIFMVTAGLVVGNHGRDFGMSEQTRNRMDVFWELIDEILNAILFMLIGLEIVIIPLTRQHLLLGLLAILATLIGRLVSVGLPVSLMGWRRNFGKGTIGLMTWGGLRGGLSIAMALSLPPGQVRETILPAAYIVVLFSILVQGLTFKPALRFLLKLP